MKAILAAVIASFLVLLSLCATIGANPTTFSYVGPSSPDTNLPKISIVLPENSTIFNHADISYSIVINKPSSWFDYGPWNGQIFSVAYSLDNSEEETIAMKEFDSYESLTSKDQITLKGSLNSLPEGNHTFEVLLYGVSYYGKGVPSNYYIRNNATATFSTDINLESNVSPTLTPTSPMPTVNTGLHTPQTEPFPTLTVLVIALIFIAAIIACISLYRRHRKQVKKN
jgi:hypothetical protein